MGNLEPEGSELAIAPLETGQDAGTSVDVAETVLKRQRPKGTESQGGRGRVMTRRP